MSSKSRPRRTPRKDPWDENVLLTSSKSKLIDLDLVKILAKPEAWSCLEEDEKRQILDLLPEHIRPTTDLSADESANGSEPTIQPLPQEFLRYSNNWRGGVRQFQVDLECGRYDPEWLSQADEAMKQRAEGKFDKWKEKEFEEFWGQKQKLDHRGSHISGEASQVGLETLVEHGVIRKGDVWTYSRVFDMGRKKASYAHAFFTGEKGGQDKVLIEKEIKVVDIVGTSLTFAAPAGQRVIFPHHIEIPQERLAAAQKSAKRNKSPRRRGSKDEFSKNTIPQRERGASKRRSSAEQRGARKKRQVEQEGNENSENMSSDTNDREISSEETKSAHGSVAEDKGTASDEPDDALNSSVEAVEADDEQQIPEALPVEATEQLESHELDPEQGAESAETKGEQATDAKFEPTKAEAANGVQSKEGIIQSNPEFVEGKQPEAQAASPQEELVIIPNIRTASSLETRILAIDGRFKGVRSVNSWKAFRCHRNNQDIGNLWEVRQAWYLKREK